MPARASHIPSHFERTTLQKLSSIGELRAAQLQIGVTTLTKMVRKGWIEHTAASGYYRITPAGNTALKAKIPVST